MIFMVHGAPYQPLPEVVMLPFSIPVPAESISILWRFLQTLGHEYWTVFTSHSFSLTQSTIQAFLNIKASLTTLILLQDIVYPCPRGDLNLLLIRCTLLRPSLQVVTTAPLSSLPLQSLNHDCTGVDEGWASTLCFVCLLFCLGCIPCLMWRAWHHHQTPSCTSKPLSYFIPCSQSFLPHL